jgi:hypothetical protein
MHLYTYFTSERAKEVVTLLCFSCQILQDSRDAAFFREYLSGSMSVKYDKHPTRIRRLVTPLKPLGKSIAQWIRDAHRCDPPSLSSIAFFDC